MWGAGWRAWRASCRELAHQLAAAMGPAAPPNTATLTTHPPHGRPQHAPNQTSSALRAPSVTRCRNARRNWTAENHIYNLLHRGFTSEARGHAACPFDFYK